MRLPWTSTKKLETAQAELHSAQLRSLALEGELAVTNDRINFLQARNRDLEHAVAELKEAAMHLGRFIATSHRLTGKPKPGTIKEMLSNATR